MKNLFITCLVGVLFNSTNAQNPVALKSFTAKWADCRALLEWTIANEATNKRYEIQVGTDSLNFTTVAAMTADYGDEVMAERKYSKSLSVISKFNYFRLKIISIDENITYSKVILLYSKECGSVEPITAVLKANPVTDHSLSIVVSVAKADNLEIRITDMSGNLIVKCNKPATGGRNDMRFYLPGAAHGQYIFNVYSKSNGIVSTKIFVQ